MYRLISSFLPVRLLLAVMLLTGCTNTSPPTPTAKPIQNISTASLSLPPPPTASPSPTFTPSPPTSFPMQLATMTTTPSFKKAVARLPMVDVWDNLADEGSYWHRLTQLVMGEPVWIIEQVGYWARIIAIEQPSSKNPLGYPGWVRITSLAPVWGGDEPTAVIMAKTSILRSAPSPNAAAIVSLYLDTRLPVSSQTSSWVELVFPNGGKGWLPATDVRLIDSKPPSPSNNDFFILAQSYVGTPYLWGGTYPLQTDCSGFTYRLFHALGIPLPRDSQDQARVGKPVAFDFNQALDSANLQRGDLLFFTRTEGGEVSHVAMAWGNGFVLDASAPRGVQMRSLVELKAEYLLHSVRRVVEFTGK